MSHRAFTFETVIYHQDYATDTRWQQTRDLMIRSGVETVTFYYISEHELRHMLLEKILPRVQRMGELAAELREHDIQALAALVPALGWGQDTVEGPYQKITGKDGSISGVGSCPLDTSLREYLCQITAAFADAGFTTFTLEDDFQLDNHRPVRGGCYCPLHLDGFSKHTGKTWTRQSLVDAIETDEQLNEQWNTYRRSTLADLAGELQKAANGAEVQLLAGAEIAATPDEVMDATNCDEWRPSQGNYLDNRFAAVAGAYWGASKHHRLSQRRKVRALAELTHWPRTAYTKSWNTMLNQAAISAFLGIDAALFWAGLGPRDDGFVAAMKARRSWYDTIREAGNTHPTLVGVGVDRLSHGALYLSRMGLPITFDMDNAAAIWGEDILDVPAMQDKNLPLMEHGFFACERSTNDPCNGSFADWPGSCLTLLKQGEFFTTDRTADLRVLADFLDNDSNVLGPSVAIDETNRRLLCFHTPIMWEKLIGQPKAFQLQNAISDVFGPLPVIVRDATDTFIFARQGESPDSLAVLLVNQSQDAQVSWSLDTPRPIREASIAADDGSWQSCDVASLTLPMLSVMLLELRF